MCHIVTERKFCKKFQVFIWAMSIFDLYVYSTFKTKLVMKKHIKGFKSYFSTPLSRKLKLRLLKIAAC